MTVDEILAAGWYTDKRGRSWRRLPLSGRWADQVIDHQGIHWAGQKIEAAQMRLLIERDQHRDVCPGLHDCGDHPVHHAVFYRWERAFRVYEPDPNSVETIRCETLPEAMDAALAWAVGG